MVWWLWAPAAYSMFPLAESATEPDATPPAALEKYCSQSFCSWTPHGGFTHFSDNWETITGQSPKQCAADKWIDSFSPEAQMEFHLTVEDLLSADPANRTEHAELYCQTRLSKTEARWLKLILVPQLSSAHRMVSIIAQDVTKQKRLEEQQEFIQRDLNHTRESRATFLSNMSHELRTPLNAILGFSQMLESGEAIPASRMHEYLHHIRQSGECLLGKISDLIEVANIDSANTTLREEEISLADWLDIATEIHTHRAFQNDVRITYDHAIPKLVLRGDRARLVSSLSHLIGNAVRHSEAGGVVRIRCHSSTHDGVTISVHDDGPGINHSQLTNIKAALKSSQPYYQATNDHIGIGLAVTKELIELHDGSVSIESKANHGTIARLHLPATRIKLRATESKPRQKRFRRVPAAIAR